MSDEYLTAFVRESEENITDLNNSLLALESDPENEAAMDSIFRTAHTLKGNFGAMGYSDASALAHAIEDLLDEIRQGRMDVSVERMDLVFDGVDRIEGILAEIEAEGDSSIDPTPTVDRIRSVIADAEKGENGAEGDDGGESDVAGTDTDDTGTSGAAVEPADDPDAGDPPDLPDLPDPLSETLLLPDTYDGETASLLAVTIPESEMRGVDGMLALDAIEESVPIVGLLPGREAIENGEYDEGFDTVVLGTPEEAEAAIEGIGRIESATVADVTDRLLAGTADTTSADGAATDGDVEADSTEAGSAEGSGEQAKETATVDAVKSVRVDVTQLDDLHSLVEQLVTSRIKLRRSIEAGETESASDTLDEFDKISSDLQNTVMDMRLIPLKKVVGKFPRLIRDLARSQDKEIDFAMEGVDVELDRTILDEISDPLMHILRNAADHGIESPEERERAGKPREGTIRLRATRERDHVTIEVIDDGGGLDVSRIREKALEKGVRSEAELDAMADSDVYDLIFHPGFSTSEEITDVSGRGVGMDVVHTTISRLDGSVSVDSEPGEGTTVTLRLPVSVAIVKVLFVQVGEAEYGIPIKNIDEVGRVRDLRTIGGQEVTSHDDEIYPVIRLREALSVPERSFGSATGEADPADVGTETDPPGGTGALAATDGGGGTDGGGDGGDTNADLGADRREEGMLIRIRESERQVALHCDGVNDQEEVVVRPFEGELGGTAGLSGTAVIGDGNVVPILDVVTL